MNKFGENISYLILITLTQITEHSLTKTNAEPINFDGEGRSGSQGTVFRVNLETLYVPPDHAQSPCCENTDYWSKIPPISPSPHLLISLFPE